MIYLAISGAEAKLKLTDVILDEYNGQQTPFIVVHNSGTAHGRTTGLVDAVDANGKRIEFEITPLPVLPGHTRRVPLFQPTIDDQAPEPFIVPLELKGVIEWDGGRETLQRRVE